MATKNLRQLYDERADEIAYDSSDPSQKIVGIKNPSRKFEEIIKHLDFKDGGNVIEVGCGTGPYVAYLSSLNKHPLIIASDISPKILLQAKKRVEYEGIKDSVQYVACDMQFCPFKDNFFDNILATQVIEHVPDDEKGLDELYRILKKDGLLIISTDNKKNYISKILDFPLKITCIILGIKREFKFYHRDYSPIEFKKKIEMMDFEVLKFSTFRFSLSYPFYKIKWLVKPIDIVEKILIKLPFFHKCGDIIIAECKKMNW